MKDSSNNQPPAPSQSLTADDFVLALKKTWVDSEVPGGDGLKESGDWDENIYEAQDVQEAMQELFDLCKIPHSKGFTVPKRTPIKPPITPTDLTYKFYTLETYDTLEMRRKEVLEALKREKLVCRQVMNDYVASPTMKLVAGPRSQVQRKKENKRINALKKGHIEEGYKAEAAAAQKEKESTKGKEPSSRRRQDEAPPVTRKRVRKGVPASIVDSESAQDIPDAQAQGRGDV